MEEIYHQKVGSRYLVANNMKLIEVIGFSQLTSPLWILRTEEYKFLDAARGNLTEACHSFLPDL